MMWFSYDVYEDLWDFNAIATTIIFETTAKKTIKRLVA